ncbi:hypothetical protein [Streptomyces sp. NPDC056948]|uniref:hypothetical protein n=1 Tax=Streptomyces sp. NPDC056948 TaxID=3345975 RepID=UPI0036330A5B
MSIRRTGLKRAAVLVFLIISFYVLRTPGSRPEVAEREAETEPDRSKREAFWEPYKIAIAAFYAICVQRAFETSVQKFTAEPPRIRFDSGDLEAHIESDQVVLVCQLLAVLTWMGLFYINNVRLYFLIPVGRSIRRALAHMTLTAALAQFYFLAATIGSPSVNQLLLISGILFTDAIFPIAIGPVLSSRLRTIWVIRGAVQTSFIFWILFFVPPVHYVRVEWSAIMLLLMLVQLFVLAPLESRARRRIAASL